MKKLFAVLLLLCVFQITMAQKSPVKYGDIPLADLKMTTYPLDTSAVAVVLVEYGESSIIVRLSDQTTISDRRYTFRMQHKRHTRIKILKNAGLNSANIGILLYHAGNAEESVSGMKGTTYNLEGERIVASPLAKENIFKEKFNKNNDHQKFTMPNVRVGSVIEYTYIIDSEYWTSFPSWTFQHKNIPVRHSEYWAIVPRTVTFQKYMTGYLTPTYEQKSIAWGGEESNAEHWTMENSPSFVEEPFMSSKDDYISRVNFALAGYKGNSGYIEILTNWQKVIKALNGSEAFGMVVSKSGFLQPKADEITAGITDQVKKIEAIDTWVKQTIEWDGENGNFCDNPKKIFENKRGDAGDINLLLASLLDKVGIPVQMVMLSTRENGFVREAFPMTRQFDYAICLATVEGRKILLDATEKYLPMGILPERCLNESGLLVNADCLELWVDLTAKVKAKTVVTVDFTLNETGELRGKLGYLKDGYAALAMRKKYLTGGEETYMTRFKGDHPWQILKSEFTDVNSFDKSVKETYDVVLDQHASVAGDVIYINPYVDSRTIENPFKSDSRIFPVDFGRPEETMYMCKITIPEGFVVDELPQSKALVLPGNVGRFSYNVTQLGNKINLASTMQINKTLFSQAEYPALREFYAQVIAKQNEQIVIRKK